MKVIVRDGNCMGKSGRYLTYVGDILKSNYGFLMQASAEISKVAKQSNTIVAIRFTIDGDRLHLSFPE